MIDLNASPLPDLLHVGLSADEAKAVLDWRPFSSWDAVLQVLDADDQRIAEFRAAGAILTEPRASLWPTPRRFRLSER